VEATRWFRALLLQGRQLQKNEAARILGHLKILKWPLSVKEDLLSDQVRRFKLPILGIVGPPEFRDYV